MGSDRVKCGETAGASNTLRSLTHSLDCGKEGLAVHATHETWRPVVGHEGSYEVSDQGNVRSLDRTTIRNGHVHKLRGKVLVPVRASEYGYLRVSLGRGKPQFVHRLVAAAFIGPGDGVRRGSSRRKSHEQSVEQSAVSDACREYGCPARAEAEMQAGA